MPKKTTPVEEGLKVAEALLNEDTASLWDQLLEVTKDGKLSPQEVPVVLDMLSEVLQGVATAISVAPSVDPRAKIILSVVATACSRVSVSLAKEEPKIERSWKLLSEVMKDNKLGLLEVPKFIEGSSDLAESLLTICVPFVKPEFTDKAKALAALLLRISSLASLGKEKEEKKVNKTKIVPIPG